jgi:hypothetical protein
MIDIFSGKYIREGVDEKATLDVTYLGENKVAIKGIALWGIQDTFGPKMGELDFVSEAQGNTATYTTTFGNNEYLLTLEFLNNSLIAKEKIALGMFGMNVRFEGEYKKEKSS